uniref:4Fe-4S cluster binding protein n=1 Tax=Paulinella chromatophora TaxID=39717 RepID=B1X4H8_PAUCH|nr:4Fe-4S cluster binding protein [Paulinella chromatophora]ACB42847.1 4Fe-4S cluster binding protein [Paulinella chromatophora]
MIINQRLTEALKERAYKEKFDLVGIANIHKSHKIPLRNSAMQAWLANGNQASMVWMQDPYRQLVEELLPGIKSILAVGIDYYIKAERAPGKLAIARYGWGQDYHRIIDQRLRRIGRWLEQQVPNCRWRTCVDSSPFIDKAWAEEAGLGWIGKNSNLIHPRIGSWLLLGHLLVDIDLPADTPTDSHCGNCRRCIEACPTGAISEPFVIDSRHCIAFHTIENRNSELPELIKKQMGLWIVGCDICQDVCPWNHSPISSAKDLELHPRDWILELTTQQTRAWSDEEWQRKLRDSALKRIKPWMWRRNIGHIVSK